MHLAAEDRDQRKRLALARACTHITVWTFTIVGPRGARLQPGGRDEPDHPLPDVVGRDHRRRRNEAHVAHDIANRPSSGFDDLDDLHPADPAVRSGVGARPHTLASTVAQYRTARHEIRLRQAQ